MIHQSHILLSAMILCNSFSAMGQEVTTISGNNVFESVNPNHNLNLGRSKSMLNPSKTYVLKSSDTKDHVRPKAQNNQAIHAKKDRSNEPHNQRKPHTLNTPKKVESMDERLISIIESRKTMSYNDFVSKLKSIDSSKVTNAGFNEALRMAAEKSNEHFTPFPDEVAKSGEKEKLKSRIAKVLPSLKGDHGNHNHKHPERGFTDQNLKAILEIIGTRDGVQKDFKIDTKTLKALPKGFFGHSFHRASKTENAKKTGKVAGNVAYVGQLAAVAYEPTSMIAKAKYIGAVSSIMLAGKEQYHHIKSHDHAKTSRGQRIGEILHGFPNLLSNLHHRKKDIAEYKEKLEAFPKTDKEEIYIRKAKVHRQKAFLDVIKDRKKLTMKEFKERIINVQNNPAYDGKINQATLDHALMSLRTSTHTPYERKNTKFSKKPSKLMGAFVDQYESSKHNLFGHNNEKSDKRPSVNNMIKIILDEIAVPNKLRVSESVVKSLAVGNTFKQKSMGVSDFSRTQEGSKPSHNIIRKGGQAVSVGSLITTTGLTLGYGGPVAAGILLTNGVLNEPTNLIRETGNAGKTLSGYYLSKDAREYVRNEMAERVSLFDSHNDKYTPPPNKHTASDSSTTLVDGKLTSSSSPHKPSSESKSESDKRTSGTTLFSGKDADSDILPIKTAPTRVRSNSFSGFRFR